MRCLPYLCKRSYLCTVVAGLLLLNLVGIAILLHRITVGGEGFGAMGSRKRLVVKDRSRLAIDKRKAPNASTVYRNIGREMPYLPIEDLDNMPYKDRNINYSCAWYPSLIDVQIHNEYWQEFHNNNITYYIFGAYLDRRPNVTKDRPVVRVLTMIHFISPNRSDYPPTYCQLWYKEQREPVITQLSDISLIWYYDWGHGSEHNYPHLLDCPVSEEHKDWVPETVALVSSPCDKATNNVKVYYQPLKENEEKKGFAVCVKGMDFPYVDLSHRLVEWIETMRSLGADKIVMYNLQVHPNITKVLEYYEEAGIVEFRPFSSSLAVGNSKEYRHMKMVHNYYPFILHEVVPYNDCFYRNMYLYKYVAAIDIDEVPMPMGNLSNWFDLVEFGESVTHDNCNKFASFCFRCIYFPRYEEKPVFSQEFPEYFYMMQHVHRVREHIRPEWATKCLHNTDRVIATHNHFPLYWDGDVCWSYSFEAKDAQLQHYRQPPEEETLVDPVIDTSLWRFKDEVIERSMHVFEDLDFFEELNERD